MSNKDNENKNSQQLFSEDITKKLVKKILDDKPENIKATKQPDFNIEYEDYDTQQFDENLEEDFDEEYSYEEDYEEDYYEYDNNIKSSKKAQSKKINKNTKNKNPYRKNIEIYGKDFFEDEDDYDDYEDNSSSLIGKVISFSIIIVLTLSTAFLALSLKFTKKELTDAKTEIQELLDNKEEIENKLIEESLKSEVEALKTENEDLKSQLNPNNVNTSNDPKTQPASKNNITNSNTLNSSNNSSSSEYIVKEGDIIWNISKQVYGNGSYYQKILDANGLTENSILKPGQKLIIPNLN